jgi:hypothetical protein
MAIMAGHYGDVYAGIIYCRGWDLLVECDLFG